MKCSNTVHEVVLNLKAKKKNVRDVFSIKSKFESMLNLNNRIT